ncbi:hypothetical protein TWF730_007475 [Orbilia blumenaviensis]|uniref:WW domain-containing protein n=1 Tax=Orbilia blumenaviensis TaxID=1796055 RepID=A0AAV9VEB6_9PEZI
MSYGGGYQQGYQGGYQQGYQPGYQQANSYAQNFIGHPTDPNIGLPPGWIARWDQNTQHWYYVDTSTGRSVWERPIMPPPQQQPPYGPPPPQHQQPQQPIVAPQAGYYAAGGAAAGAAVGAAAAGSHKGDSGAPGSYDHHFDDKGYHKNWSSHQDSYKDDKHKKPSSSPKAPKKDKNWGKYAAVGAGALGLGVVGGAVLAHEGGEIKDWAEGQVGSAEERLDGFKDNIENIPENVAGWTGEQVGKVEGFGDDLGEAYDQGRDDGRYGSDHQSSSGSSSSSSEDGGSGDGGDDYEDDGGDDGDDYED